MKTKGKNQPRCAASFTLLAAIGILAAGCKAIKPQDMVSTNFAVEKKHTGSVGVFVPPGTKNAIYGEGHWTSQITAGTFAESLTQSLQKSGVFTTVLKTPDADYLLQVSFVDTKEPAAAFNMKVDLITKWILTRRSTGEDLFRENVATTYTAKLGRAFAGGTRLRLANEGAGRENIKEGIRRLSQLKL